MSTHSQIAADELTGRLTHDQARQARVAAARDLNNLVLIAPTPGADRVPACPWCLEAAGYCDATGGPNLCEGHDEHAFAVTDAVAAPEVRTPFRTEGDAR